MDKQSPEKSDSQGRPAEPFPPENRRHFQTESEESKAAEETEALLKGLYFKRIFWILFGAIAIIQLYNLGLMLHFGLDLDSYPPQFYLYSETGGIVWAILLVAFVLNDLRSHSIPPSVVLNINFSILRDTVARVLKYFAGCTLIVIALSFMSSQSELGLEHQAGTAVILSLIAAVMVAPVAEEIVFRGYLYSSMFSTFKRKKERLVVNAMLFAAAHVFLVQFILGAEIPYYIFVLGYLLAKLYEESRSVLPCIVLHALNNGLVFGIDLIKINM